MSKPQANEENATNENAKQLPYIRREEGTFRVTYDSKGKRYEVQIANFTAWIEEEQIRDDGDQTELFYVIAGRAKEPFPKLTIPAKHFNSMNWLSEWGARAVIAAGTK